MMVKNSTGIDESHQTWPVPVHVHWYCRKRKRALGMRHTHYKSIYIAQPSVTELLLTKPQLPITLCSPHLLPFRLFQLTPALHCLLQFLFPFLLSFDFLLCLFGDNSRGRWGRRCTSVRMKGNYAS